MRRWSGENVQSHFAGMPLFRRESGNEPWPAPKLDRPINDEAFGLLDCFGVVGANQGLEPYKAAVKTNGISSVFCHRSHRALKTQLAARASRDLYTSEHNSNGIFKIKRGQPLKFKRDHSPCQRMEGASSRNVATIAAGYFIGSQLIGSQWRWNAGPIGRRDTRHPMK
jgi:hypothetical protein